MTKLAQMPGFERDDAGHAGAHTAPHLRTRYYAFLSYSHKDKALADWTIVDAVRFRGGFQRANRAPNIGELFLPDTQAVSAL